MNITDIVLICFAFFILGFGMGAALLLFSRIRYTFKKRTKSFYKPANYVPELDLKVDAPPSSVDGSSAAKDFKIQR